MDLCNGNDSALVCAFRLFDLGVVRVAFTRGPGECRRNRIYDLGARISVGRMADRGKTPT